MLCIYENPYGLLGIEHAYDHLCRLRSGSGIVRLEGAILVAAYDSGFNTAVDEILRPVGIDIED